MPFLLVEPEKVVFDWSGLQAALKTPFKKEIVELKLSHDPSLAARNLYSELRKHSEKGEPFFFCLFPEFKKSENWLGLIDRLRKACHHSATQKNGVWKIYKK